MSASAVTVTNVVSLVSLIDRHKINPKIDLRPIIENPCKTYSLESNPGSFPGVRMMIDKPRTTGLIFESGKLMCLGAKSENESRKAARRMARIIWKLPVNQRIVFRNFEIKNVVGRAEIGHSVDHVELAKFLGLPIRPCEDETKKFKPKVIDYHMSDPKVQMKIFRSGKVTIFGCKSVSDLHMAWKVFTQRVAEFMAEKNTEIDFWMSRFKLS